MTHLSCLRKRLSTVFKKNPLIEPEESSGPVVVCGEGEELSLSSEEWQLLSRGHKYSVVRGCREKDMREEEQSSANLSEVERKENKKFALLAEDMGAQQRMAFNSENKAWDAKGLRVRDSSRVLFPKHQSGSKKRNLET